MSFQNIGKEELNKKTNETYENMNYYKKELDKIHDMLNENNFKNIEELKMFITKYKKHDCNNNDKNK